MNLPIKFKKNHPDAKSPTYAHEGDAGFDLFSVETVTILPGERYSIDTGVAFEIPKGYVGLIWDKSGISQVHGLKNLGGVIDSGYRGSVKVGLVNLSDKPYTFEKGHKTGQMLVQKIEVADFIEVDDLGETERGEGGFGSSGK